jgi:hypothetical protein
MIFCFRYRSNLGRLGYEEKIRIRLVGETQGGRRARGNAPTKLSKKLKGGLLLLSLGSLFCFPDSK